MECFWVIKGKSCSLFKRIINGNFAIRCSLLGFDLNRVWSEPSHWAHPEIYGIKTHIMNLNEDAVSSR